LQEASSEHGQVVAKGGKIHATSRVVGVSNKGTRHGGKSWPYGQEGDGEST